MATLNISLPEPMKDWVEEQIQQGKYINASDYVRDLIRRDQERYDELLRLSELLAESIDGNLGPRRLEQALNAARERAMAELTAQPA